MRNGDPDKQCRQLLKLLCRAIIRFGAGDRSQSIDFDFVLSNFKCKINVLVK